MTFTNWKSYFLDEQINDYNLKSNDIITLFNTNDISLNNIYNINYLNTYLGELTMMYYIWKNNLYSDYICISQYRKDITDINFDKLKDNKIQVICKWEEPVQTIENRLFNDNDDCDPSGFIFNKLIDFLKEKYDISIEELNNKIVSNNKLYCFAIFVFACNWNVYCKLCEFIFGFLDFLLPNDLWKNTNALELLREIQYSIYIKKHKIDSNKWYLIQDKRYLFFVIEKIFSILLNLFFETYIQNDNEINLNIFSYNNENKGIIEIAKFYKKNISINPNNIYIHCNDDIFDEVNTFFKKCDYEFPKIKIINTYDSNIIEKCMFQFDNINKYVDAKTPIDVFNNNYTIKDL